MESLPLIGQLYLVSFAVGSLFVLFSAALTGFAGHAGHGGHSLGHGHGGHGGLLGGHGHGHASVGHLSGHGSSHGHASTGHSGTASGHGTGSNSHAPGHGNVSAHGHSHGSTNHGGGHGDQGGDTKSGTPSRQPDINTMATRTQSSTFISVLGVLNPTAIAVFLTCFGTAGICLWKSLPFVPIAWTVIPALIGALLLAKMMLSFLSFFASKLRSESINFKMADLIGYPAEASSAIKGGSFGEITYVVGSKRYTNPAKPKLDTLHFKRGDKVMIADIQPDGTLIIEPWLDPDDEFIKLDQAQQADPAHQTEA